MVGHVSTYLPCNLIVRDGIYHIDICVFARAEFAAVVLQLGACADVTAYCPSYVNDGTAGPTLDASVIIKIIRRKSRCVEDIKRKRP